MSKIDLDNYIDFMAEYKKEISKEYEEEIERLNKCYCNRSDCAGRLNQKNEVYDSVVQRNEKAIEYIENEMPCLWEVDDVWEDIEGNYQHNYKEYDPQILLNKLKGDDKE